MRHLAVWYNYWAFQYLFTFLRWWIVIYLFLFIIFIWLFRVVFLSISIIFLFIFVHPLTCRTFIFLFIFLTRVIFFLLSILFQYLESIQYIISLSLRSIHEDFWLLSWEFSSLLSSWIFAGLKSQHLFDIHQSWSTSQILFDWEIYEDFSFSYQSFLNFTWFFLVNEIFLYLFPLIYLSFILSFFHIIFFQLQLSCLFTLTVFQVIFFRLWASQLLSYIFVQYFQYQLHEF